MPGGWHEPPACIAQGGTPIDYVTNVTVNADSSSTFSLFTYSGGSSTLIQNEHTPAPSKVGCSTVLPNGKTLGQYINQGRAQLQAEVDNQDQLAAAGGDVNPLGVESAFLPIALPHGPIDFKNGAAGPGGNQALLGQAGNFAYYAIGSGYISPTVLDIGASAYSLYALKPFSSLGQGPLLIDASAASVRTAALATPGCSN